MTRWKPSFSANDDMNMNGMISMNGVIDIDESREIHPGPEGIKLNASEGS